MFGAPTSKPTEARIPPWLGALWRRLGTTATFVFLLLIVVAVYRLATVEVQLTIDGETSTVSTRAGTVRELLIDHAVPVSAGDLVVPGPFERVTDGAHVVVQRSLPASVRADGTTVHLRSHGRSALALLAEAGVRLGPRDVVTVNGAPWPVDRSLPPGASVASDGIGKSESDRAPRFSVANAVLAAEESESAHGATLLEDPSGSGAADSGAMPLPGTDNVWLVEVWRAAQVSVVEHDTSYSLTLAGPTVGYALSAAGIELYDQDEVWPDPDNRLQGVAQIVIERATPFVIEADGDRKTVRAVAKTVGDGLNQAGLGLLGHDYAIPDAATPLSAGLEVKVIRVKEDILVREVPIGFSTQYEPDASMNLDDKRVDRPGEPGLKSQRIRITYENGEEIDREIIEETVLRDPVAEIVSYGTNILWKTVSTPQGPKRYWRQMRVYATSYSLTRSGTSPNAPWYGLTRSGLPMRHGIVAVDRRYIPFMSNLYVPDYGVGLAADTGGGIKQYHIDLGYDDDNYQSWHWLVDLYLLEPLPPDEKMIWLLP